jgi:predicted Rossmann-fold nucleotide-binding protein
LLSVERQPGSLFVHRVRLVHRARPPPTTVECTRTHPLHKRKEYFIRRSSAILSPKVGALSAI